MNFWAKWSERERKLMILAGVCLALYILYALIYSSTTQAVLAKQQELLEKKSTLSWMQTAAHMPRASHTISVVNESQLLTLITQQLSQTSFKSFPYHLQQTNAHDIQLSFERVPYVEIMSWLWSLTGQYHMTIQQLSVKKTQTPGVVSVTLVGAV